mgnify:FL=1
MEKTTKPIMEGGILAGIAIVMAMLGVYLPLLGIAFIYTWSVPLIVLAVRHDFKWSVLTAVVITILTALLLSPLTALSLMLIYGILGIAIGQCIRLNFTPIKTVIISSIVSILSLTLYLSLSFMLTNINPIDEQEKFISQVSTVAVQVYTEANVPTEKIAEITEATTKMASDVKMLFPLIIICFGFLSVWLNYKVAGLVLNRLGTFVEPIPSFSNWRFSTLALYIYAFALVGLYWGTTREIYLLKQLSYNIQQLANIIMLLQGLSLCYYLAKKYNLSKMVWSIILILIFLNGFMIQTVAIAGAFDMIIDYRKRINNT